MAMSEIQKKFLHACKETVAFFNKGKADKDKIAIFGGALRDEIADVNFNDVDIYLGNSIPPSKFCQEVLNQLHGLKDPEFSFSGYKGQAEFSQTKYGSENLLKSDAKLSFNRFANEFNIQFVKSKDGTDTYKNFNQNIDADVNSLVYDGEKLTSSVTLSQPSNSLINSIQKGDFSFYQGEFCNPRLSKIRKWSNRVKKKNDQEMKQAVYSAASSANIPAFSPASVVAPKTEGSKAMTTKKTSLVERNKVAMTEAAYGVAATKIQDFAQQGLLEVAKTIFTSEDERKVAEKILGHEFMKALIGLGIGNAAHYIPGIEDKAQAEKLANKTMEVAYMRAGVYGIDSLIEKFAPNVMGIMGQMSAVIESLPEVPASEKNLRVAPNDDVDVSFEEEEEYSSRGAKLRAVLKINHADRP